MSEKAKFSAVTRSALKELDSTELKAVSGGIHDCPNGPGPNEVEIYPGVCIYDG